MSYSEANLTARLVSQVHTRAEVQISAHTFCCSCTLPLSNETRDEESWHCCRRGEGEWILALTSGTLLPWVREEPCLLVTGLRNWLCRTIDIFTFRTNRDTKCICRSNCIRGSWESACIYNYFVGINPWFTPWIIWRTISMVHTTVLPWEGVTLICLKANIIAMPSTITPWTELYSVVLAVPSLALGCIQFLAGWRQTSGPSLPSHPAPDFKV